MAIAFKKNSAKAHIVNPDHTDYILNIYQADKKVASKYCLDDIKKITGNEDSDDKVWGGLQNGRIALWDLRTQSKMPD